MQHELRKYIKIYQIYMRNDININNANKIMQILLSQYHNRYYCKFNQESLLKLIIKLTIYSKLRFQSEAENRKISKTETFFTLNDPFLCSDQLRYYLIT